MNAFVSHPSQYSATPIHFDYNHHNQYQHKLQGTAFAPAPLDTGPLEELFSRINRLYFHNEIRLGLQWGIPKPIPDRQFESILSRPLTTAPAFEINHETGYLCVHQYFALKQPPQYILYFILTAACLEYSRQSSKALLQKKAASPPPIPKQQRALAWLLKQGFPSPMSEPSPT